MTRIIPILLMLTAFIASLGAQDYRIVATKSGKDITLTAMARELKKYDVIFFGEYHDHAVLHGIQHTLVPLLYNQDKRLILSFEMFERDTQDFLDDYLAGNISEEVFLKNSRPWPNYKTDYAPLIEFAKKKGLTAIAANIPRRLAGMAVRNGKGKLGELPNEDKVLMALQISASNGKYKENFMNTMTGMGAHGDATDKELYERMFFAQCMKDDTMAESIIQYMERHPKHRIIHINGDFHSREYLGTVERVLSRNRKLKVAVISPQYKGEKIPYQANKIADYLIVVSPNP
ncbi:MAG: ChaN family lipoprotein [Candidatus Cloacimonadaceae bacterium]|nr:ChaN family lipoprotein [Candidatus Cloacimonadaceae bacterium]MDP3115273.1 ChaN family lipoprotein [Candidatus Cloacimonadaceae bacterium]